MSTFDAPPLEASGVELFFFPDYREGNPYQRLMYDHMPGVLARPGTLAEALACQEGLAGEAGSRRVVLHLHWLHPLLHGVKGEAAVRQRQGEVMAQLRRFVALGGVLIWTVHNEVSHETRHPDIERGLAAEIARLAHRIHLHSARIVPLLEAHYPVPPAPPLACRRGRRCCFFRVIFGPTRAWTS